MLSLELLFIPLLAAFLLLFANEKAAKPLALLFSFAEAIFTIYAYQVFQSNGPEAFDFQMPWVSKPQINLHFGLDGIGLLMVILTNLLIPFIILSGFQRTTKRAAAFYALLSFMHFALLGVFMALDGFVYYIFWELALIPIYFMAFNWGDENSPKVTLKFFIYTLAGSLLMLFGFIYLYMGTLNHSLDWSILSTQHTCSCNQTWLFWLFFIAFAIKIPIIPFHTWQPDTYRSAPTQGTMLLSGIMLKMGTFSLLRWLLPILPSGMHEWQPLVITLSVIGIVYASVIAIMQKDLKKLFAYSSIAHVGLIAAGTFTLSLEGLQGALVQMLAHGINVVGLFFCADIILNRKGTLQIHQLGGIRLQSPWFAAFFLIVVLGAVALPLTNGFVGEFMLLYSLFKYNVWLGAVAGTSIILGAVYMLKMYQEVMLGDAVEQTEPMEALHWNEKIVLSGIVALIIILGIFPGIVTNLTQPAVEQLLKLI